MMRRIGSTYLWFSPLAFVPLAALYHLVNFWAGVVGGLVHFTLVVLGMHAKRVFKPRAGESGSLLGAALLLIGGAVVWATGPSGPPDPAHLAVAEYNQGGLTLGFFVTLLGFAALVPALASTRERAAGSVGRACFALMFADARYKPTYDTTAETTGGRCCAIGHLRANKHLASAWLNAKLTTKATALKRTTSARRFACR